MEEIKKIVEQAKLAGLSKEEAWTSAVKIMTDTRERNERLEERELQTFAFLTEQEDKRRVDEKKSRVHEKEMEDKRLAHVRKEKIRVQQKWK